MIYNSKYGYCEKKRFLICKNVTFVNSNGFVQLTMNAMIINKLEAATETKFVKKSEIDCLSIEVMSTNFIFSEKVMA
jgi:hypothetical protein